MEYYPVFLFLHIAAGSLALLTGAIAMGSSKGKSQHRTLGKAFVFTMGLTGTTAIVMSLIKPNVFLLAVGVFTLYMVLGGWNWGRSTRPDRKIVHGRRIGLGGILSALLLLIVGWYYGGEALVILSVFALIQLLMAVADLRPAQPEQFVFRHISRMGGAYIAAVTAFMVVNLTHWPSLLVWLGPSAVGTILISLGTAQWKRRIAS